MIVRIRKQIKLLGKPWLPEIADVITQQVPITPYQVHIVCLA